MVWRECYHMILENLSPMRYCTYDCWETSVIFYCGGKASSVCGSLVVTTQRTTYNDTMFPILRNYSLEIQCRTCSLGTSKSHPVCCDAVRRDCKLDSCWEDPGHFHVCGVLYVTSAYQTMLLHETIFLHHQTTSCFCNQCDKSAFQKRCLILGM